MNDFMDDFIFGPLNLIAYGIGFVASAIKNRPIERKAIRRFDKGGNYPILPLMRDLKANGIRFLGGRHSVTHDSSNFYVVVSAKQSRQFDYLYNFESDSFRGFSKRWQ